MNNLDNIIQNFALFVFGFLGIITLIIWTIIKLEIKKGYTIMTRVAVDKSLLNDTAIALKVAIDKLEKENIKVPDTTEVSYQELMEYLNKIDDMNIDKILHVIDKPGQRIFLEFFDIIEDKKLNLKDLDEGLRILSAISEIAKNAGAMGIELADLDEDELDNVALEILKNVKETRMRLRK